MIPSNMFVIVVFTIMSINSMARASGDGSPANCSQYEDETCTNPFNVCDLTTGACQLVKRNENELASFFSFWSEPKFGIEPRFDRHTSVVCSVDGNYPSSDCRFFYQCENGSSTLKACDSPGLPYFDPVLERCTSSSLCPVFNCFEKFNVRVGLTGVVSPFFAYCFAPRLFRYMGESYILNSGLKDVFIPHVVTRCYGKDVLNVNSGRCEPRCLQEGVLPDTTDCSHYFLCSLVDPIGSRFTMVSHSCPEGKAFLSSEYRCVPRERVPDCAAKRAWPL